MQKAYNEMWLRIVIHKPPWSFKDLMTCFDKHWMAVISAVFDRSAHDLIKAILKMTAFNYENSCNTSLMIIFFKFT